MSLEENNYSRLEELSGSDFEIVDDEPNIIGWEVKNEAGNRIGEVDNLLFDPESRKVRYLVVDLDTDYLGLDTDRTVLIPIGIADLRGEDVHDDTFTSDREESAVDSQTMSTRSTEEWPSGESEINGGFNNEDEIGIEDDENVVIIPNVTPDQLLELPVYEKGKLTPVTETLIRNVFEGNALAGSAEASDFYDHSHFNEDRLYGQANTDNDLQDGNQLATNRIIQRPVDAAPGLDQATVENEGSSLNQPLSGSAHVFSQAEIELIANPEFPVSTQESSGNENISETEGERNYEATNRSAGTEDKIDKSDQEKENPNSSNNENKGGLW